MPVHYSGITVGAWRLLWGRETVFPETFPFPRPYRTYRTYYIQHGLFGAVFGFVVGFHNLNPQNAQAAEVLLKALGAALWSTLTAVGLAYFLCPIIESYFQKFLLAQPTGEAGEDALFLLDKRASQAATALQQLTTAASTLDLALTLHTLAEELKSLRIEVDSANQKLASSQTQIDSLSASLMRAQSDSAILRDDLNRNSRELAHVREENASLRDRAAARDTHIRQNLDPLAERLNRIEENLSFRKKRHNQLMRALNSVSNIVRRIGEDQ